jgi:peptide/nickel transport system permease protein
MPEATEDVMGIISETDPSADHHHPSADGKHKRKMGVLFWAATGWILLVVFCAIFAPFLPLQSTTKSDPCSTHASQMMNTNMDGNAAKLLELGQASTPSEAQDMSNNGVMAKVPSGDPCPSPSLASKVRALPSTRHWLGTDDAGRDTLARLVGGSQVALLVGVVSIAIGMLIGGTIGMIAGYFRGPTEGILMTIVDIALAYPALVLAIAIVAFRGQSLFNVCMAIAIVAIPAFARIARGATLTFAEREFVTAARVMGARHRRIIFRELLPNVILPVMAFALLAVAVAIVAEGGLAFLGLSVQAPRSSWGSMIKDGYTVINDSPFIVMVPSVVMFITVLAFNLVGDKFRELFDVKEGVL